MHRAIRLLGIASLILCWLGSNSKLQSQGVRANSVESGTEGTSPTDSLIQADQNGNRQIFPSRLDEPLYGQPDNRWWFEPRDIGGYEGTFRSWEFEDTEFRLQGLVRGLVAADGRIEFSGQEVSFAAESQLLADWFRRGEVGWSSVTSELYFTQPFDRNVLVDDPLRQAFAHNFEIESFQASQLFLTLGRASWALDLGKFVSPFGRYFGQQYTNFRSDGPFLRSEAIQLRETGLQLRYAGGIWRHAFALTNGGSDRDANSSKALIARLGTEFKGWSSGFSVKAQDGNGSEGQKEFNNHVGIDLARRWQVWSLAGEFLYDQYGMRRPGLDLNEITWGRSLYNRQLNKALNDPISGYGWYVNAMRRSGPSTTVVGFGQYFPEAIGDRIHDQMNWRILLKQAWMLNSRTEVFASTFFESTLDDFAVGHDRLGYFLLAGTQFHF